MMIRSAGKQARQWVVQAVHITEPPITSPAALALLAKQYFLADKSIYTETRMSRIRKRWMKNLMKTPDSQGGLTCVLCETKGLDPYTEDIDNQATLDHIIELKCGGAWNDPTNFQVMCYRCNNHKNNCQQPRTSKRSGRNLLYKIG